MAIHAITGVMGSGKSYEAVSEKIVTALRDDDERRVVTNISGLNYQAIADFINKPLDEIQRRLVHIPYERVTESNFWYDPEGGSTATVVQPGDLVVLDEIWRYFNRGAKLSEDAMRFFRMHRHYVSDDGHTCDVVLINQSFRGIHQDIRDVVEVQFECRKLKALGRPQTYQVRVIEGGERKASHVYTRNYNKKVFPLYSSYDKANAKEALDKRQSVFNTGFFKFVLPLFLIATLVCGYYIYKHFKNLGGESVSVTPAPASPSYTPQSNSSAPVASFDTGEWRLVARYVSSGFPVAVLVDSNGRFKTITSGDFRQGVANDVSVGLPPSDSDRGRATPWTGSFSTYSKSQGASK